MSERQLCSLCGVRPQGPCKRAERGEPCPYHPRFDPKILESDERALREQIRRQNR